MAVVKCPSGVSQSTCDYAYSLGIDINKLVSDATSEVKKAAVAEVIKKMALAEKAARDTAGAQVKSTIWQIVGIGLILTTAVILMKGK